MQEANRRLYFFFSFAFQEQLGNQAKHHFFTMQAAMGFREPGQTI